MRESAHANALLLGETGLLLRGPSGSGKSALTFELIEREERRGGCARLIGDDRVFLENCNGRLLAHAHPRTPGAIELRGLGLASLTFERVGVIRCVVDLALSSAPMPPRLPAPDQEAAVLCGLVLPRRVFTLGDAVAAEKICLFLQWVKRM
jgi:HPr kinase/phosphorylase